MAGEVIFKMDAEQGKAMQAMLAMREKQKMLEDGWGAVGDKGTKVHKDIAGKMSETDGKMKEMAGAIGGFGEKFLGLSAQIVGIGGVVKAAADAIGNHFDRMNLKAENLRDMYEQVSDAAASIGQIQLSAKIADEVSKVKSDDMSRQQLMGVAAKFVRRGISSPEEVRNGVQFVADQASLGRDEETARSTYLTVAKRGKKDGFGEDKIRDLSALAMKNSRGAGLDPELMRSLEVLGVPLDEAVGYVSDVTRMGGERPFRSVLETADHPYSDAEVADKETADYQAIENVKRAQGRKEQLAIKLADLQEKKKQVDQNYEQQEDKMKVGIKSGNELFGLPEGSGVHARRHAGEMALQKLQMQRKEDAGSFQDQETYLKSEMDAEQETIANQKLTKKYTPEDVKIKRQLRVMTKADQVRFLIKNSDIVPGLSVRERSLLSGMKATNMSDASGLADRELEEKSQAEENDPVLKAVEDAKRIKVARQNMDAPLPNDPKGLEAIRRKNRMDRFENELDKTDVPGVIKFPLKQLNKLDVAIRGSGEETVKVEVVNQRIQPSRNGGNPSEMEGQR